MRNLKIYTYVYKKKNISKTFSDMMKWRILINFAQWRTQLKQQMKEISNAAYMNVTFYLVMVFKSNFDEIQNCQILSNFDEIQVKFWRDSKNTKLV